MRTHPLTVVALTSLALFCSACETARGITATGKVIREAYKLSDFDSVEISSAFEADIRQGASFAVEVETDQAALPYLDVRVSGRKLVIAAKSKFQFRDIRARATVSMPSLSNLNASGASRVKLEGFSTGAKLRLEASGASHVTGDAEAESMDLVASGASEVALSGGGTQRLHAIASGASRMDLLQFHAEESSVVASGASSIKVNTRGRMDAVASGASQVTYTGNPILGAVNSSGASSVKPAN